MYDNITSKSGTRGGHGRTRRFPGARGRAPQNRELRQREATERKTFWESLSPTRQLEDLSKRPGDSARQRARIQAKIRVEENAMIAAKPTKRGGW